MIDGAACDLSSFSVIDLLGYVRFYIAYGLIHPLYPIHPVIILSKINI
jgi:hypothetical protein